MSLSAATERQLKHTRNVTCEGYERTDGLWDIEAHLTDTKTYAIHPDNGGRVVNAGTPIHGMHVRLTIDTSLLVHAIEVNMEHTPYRSCNSIEAAFQSIVGERIGSGWRQLIREKIGGVKGCTHIAELMGPIATTAYQCLYKVLFEESGVVPLNGCHIWADNGQMVAEYFPQFYRAATQDG
ncbi:hypothetical protein AB833_05645 [Chromatiales bacterium (ex Bugula neritina AB1)]|nr:hypothetical protein AB833_05645 [Chromatiales bacterium (ex Bugula neritina AB1)]